MKFNVNQQDLQQALNYCQGIIEKRSTLPILSNILLDAKRDRLTITKSFLGSMYKICVPTPMAANALFGAPGNIPVFLSLSHHI